MSFAMSCMSCMICELCEGQSMQTVLFAISSNIIVNINGRST